MVYLTCTLLQGALNITSIMPDLRSSGYRPIKLWKSIIFDRNMNRKIARKGNMNLQKLKYLVI